MDTNLELNKPEIAGESRDTTETSSEKELESMQNVLDTLDQDSLRDILFDILERQTKHDFVHGQK